MGTTPSAAVSGSRPALRHKTKMEDPRMGVAIGRALTRENHGHVNWGMGQLYSAV